MKLKLLKPYGILAKGDQMDVTDSVGAELIRRKVAREIKPRSRKAKA